jgi:YfiH family protein
VLLRSGVLGAARFAVTDRHGGASAAPYDTLNLAGHVGDSAAAVTENRARLAAALDLPAGRVAYLDQVHGRDVAVVGSPPADGAGAPIADAQVSELAGLGLAVLTADCVPVLLADPHGRLGVAHAGRRGVQAGVVGEAVAAMCRLGARAGELSAFVGPAICGGCYEVPEQMRAEVADALPDAWAVTRAGTPGLDLPAAVEGQLRGAGVGEVDRTDVCTAEAPGLYSHRRDTPTGRFACVVWTPA